MVTEELFFLRISQSVPGKWLQGGLNKVSSKIRNNMYIVDTIFFAQIFLIGQNKILFNILVVSKMKQWKRFRFILHSIFKNSTGWCDLVDCVPTREPKLVLFPVRAHACVAVQVPSRGHMRGSHTLMFLSLFFALFSPL